MKKHLLSVIAASSALTAFAQLPVSTAVQNKKAVLEEFTGIYCGYCPDGHRIANTIYNADPNNVVLINIHSGGYANVATGEPDFKTAEGTAIDGMTGMGITGYPAGDVNRVAAGGVMASDRGTWSNKAAAVKSQTAYVNVALEGSLNVTTRVLTAVAQVYYTGTSPEATNFLNIFLLEDAVTGPQHNYGTPTLYNAANYNPDGTYNHNHVLRKALTPTFGQAITTTTAGSSFSVSITYTVPVTYGATGKTNPCTLGNLKLVAFVTETDVNTINANHGPIALTNYASAVDLGTNSLNAEKTVCSGNLNPTFKFNNYGSSIVTDAVFSYSVNGTASGTYSWTGSVQPQSLSQTVDIPTFNFVPLASGNNTLTLDVLSVNGAADQNAINNISSFKNIAKSTLVANDTELTMNFTQDRYGSESTWTVYNESDGTVIDSDGPFTDLSAVGTALHSKTFTLDENTCYKLEVVDAYGDGIHSTYGNGGYQLVTSDGTILITSNGQYATGETKLYKTYSTVGIQGHNMNIGTINVYPNPTADVANLAIEMSQNDALNISVMNSLGQEVYSVKNKQMEAGANTVSLNTQNWSAGVYFINVSSPKGSIKQKLTVAK